MEAKKEYEVYLDRDFENWVLYCRADRTIYERQTTNELRDAVKVVLKKLPSLIEEFNETVLTVDTYPEGISKIFSGYIWCYSGLVVNMNNYYRVGNFTVTAAGWYKSTQ